MFLLRRFSLLALVVLFPLAACGDAEVGARLLKSVHIGMSLDSVSMIVGSGPLTPSTPTDSARLFHGFRSQQFFSKGRALRVLWYREEAGTVESDIVRSRETPIVLESDTVVAVGWDDFEDLAEQYRIPNPLLGKP